MLTFVLGVGVYACADRRRTLVTAVALAVPAIGLLWFETLAEAHARSAAVTLLLVFFLVFLLGVSLVRVVNASRVTLNTIFGAIAVYLLFAMVWALIYAMLCALDPGAFMLPPADAALVRSSDLRGDLSTFVYFSFVTLTTMGYGDVLPVSAAARGLAACEAVVGQVYLTVLVARLVGLHIAHAQRS